MDRRSTERFFLVTCAAMFVFGVVLAVPGTVLALPDFVARLDLTLASRGALISSLFFGLLAGSAASGPLVDRIGRRAALAGSNALIAVCLPAFAAAPSFPPAAAALVALGLVSAAGNTAANAIASGLYPDQRARRMNIIAMAVGAGGLSVPVAVALAAGRVPGRAVIAAAGALGAVVALAVVRSREPAHLGAPVVLSRRDVAAVMAQPRLAAFGVIVALSGANEASLAGWTTTYLSGGGVAPAVASWGLAIFWSGLMAGRLLFAGRVDRAQERAVIFGALAGAGSVLLLVAVRAPALMIAATGMAGLAISLVMPTALAVAGGRYPRHAGTLFGVLLSVAQAGAMTLPAVVGLVAARAGVRGGLSLLVATNLIVAAVMWRNRTKPTTPL